MGTPRRATPVPDELTEPYWQAAREQRLVMQRCVACRTYIHPPFPMCTSCYSTELSFEEVSGRGTIYSSSTMHEPMVAGFEDSLPYVCVVVELDEQPGLLMLTNLVDATADDARCGARVEVGFEEIDGGFLLPQFRLAAEGAAAEGAGAPRG
jgi:uncharacterized OB-fold protein